MKQSNNSDSPFDLLANEIIMMILLYLPLDDLKNISRVNKRFFNLLHDAVFITSWLRRQSIAPLVTISFFDGLKMPFSPRWLLRFAVQGKEMAYLSSSAVLITLTEQDKMQLLADYYHAALDYWQQLTHAQLALLTQYEIESDSWVNRPTFEHSDTLALLLLHQFPFWRIEDLHAEHELICKRQAFIAGLAEMGFLLDYNKKKLRKKWAQKDLILFPFSPEQNGTNWHQAMQWMYTQEGLGEIRYSLSEAVTSHCELLLKQNDRAPSTEWASAYLAAKCMSVCMSEKHEFAKAMDYLTLSIRWLSFFLPDYDLLYIDFAQGVGQLMFEMLAGLTNSRYLQLCIFKDYRPDDHILASTPKDIADMIETFITINPVPGRGNLEHMESLPDVDVLEKTITQGQMLFKVLKPHVTPSLHIKQISEKIELEENMNNLIEQGFKLF